MHYLDDDSVRQTSWRDVASMWLVATAIIGVLSLSLTAVGNSGKPEGEMEPILTKSTNDDYLALKKNGYGRFIQLPRPTLDP